MSNSSTVKTLFQSTFAYYRTSITLDPSRGVMFWSDWSTAPEKGSIYTAYMDGTERRSFLEENVFWPCGLAVDIKAGKLYWMDRHLGSLQSIGLDGNARKVEIDKGLGTPANLVFGPDRTLYYIDVVNGTVMSYKSENGLKKVFEGNASLQDMKIFDTNRVSFQ